MLKPFVYIFDLVDNAKIDAKPRSSKKDWDKSCRKLLPDPKLKLDITNPLP